MMKIELNREVGITELRVAFVKLEKMTMKKRKRMGFFSYVFRYCEFVARKLQKWTNKKQSV